MVISAADMTHLKSHNLPGWKRIFWMQFLAITAWANLGLAQQKYPPHLLLPYYQGFALTIFTFGILGTIFGFFLSDLLPENGRFCLLVSLAADLPACLVAILPNGISSRCNRRQSWSGNPDGVLRFFPVLAGSIVCDCRNNYLADCGGCSGCASTVRWADNGMGTHDGLCDGNGGSVAYSCASYWRLGNKQPSSASG